MVRRGIHCRIFTIVFLDVCRINAKDILQGSFIQFLRHGNAKCFSQLHHNILNPCSGCHDHAFLVLHCFIHRVDSIFRAVLCSLRFFCHVILHVVCALFNHTGGVVLVHCSVFATACQHRYHQHCCKGKSGYSSHYHHSSLCFGQNSCAITAQGM